MGSMSPPATLHNAFVCGSLLDDDVVCVLLHRIPSSSPAVLRGFHRFSIKGRVYPAILPIENKEVTGKVLLDITPFELQILDYFEDDGYERETIDVYLMRKEGHSESVNSITLMGSTSPQATLHNVFVYGGLLDNDVFCVLLHRIPSSSAAVLHGL